MQKTNVPDAVRIAPYVFTSTAVSFGSESYTTFIMGSSPDIFPSFHLDVAQGMEFTSSDVSGISAVAVIGQKLASELFGANNPIGQNIKIKTKNFRIIGILAPKGQMVSLNWDEMVLTPYSSLQQYVLGIHYFNQISVEASSLTTMPTVIADITRVLRQDHNITDPTKDDFYIQTQEDAANTVSSITNILTLLLTSVAAISLVVGGIGIMNIMLVSVTERTREIGLRKSLGATDKNILVQFLTEAIMLTLAGGIIGIILGTSVGFLLTYLVDRFSSLALPYAFSLSGAILGVVVSSVIGLAFGIFPARQASQKSPIEALRYE
jgi:putative ABC transport system permease protein